jgi:ribosomal protein S18 acetylase RimI-like enzyme
VEFNIQHRPPTVSEYNGLRQLAGWPTFNPALAEKGLSNSLFSVCIIDQRNSLLGVGRVIGDGALYFHIQDVIVHPNYQRSGIGKIIMNELLEYIDGVGGENTSIGLMCSKGREQFYVDFGFIARPNEKYGSGMIKIKSSGV